MYVAQVITFAEASIDMIGFSVGVEFYKGIFDKVWPRFSFVCCFNGEAGGLFHFVVL